MINYYTVLEVSENASAEEIKAAFKKLAVKYHPDKHAGNPDMEERFKEINQAYQVLSHSFERARHDIHLRYGKSTSDSYYSPPPPRSTRYRKRRSYTEPPIDWRENWIATAYAFVFTFVVAAIVMSGIWIKNFIDTREMEQLLAERRALFENAKSQYRLGKVGDALVTINALGGFLRSEEDMELYKSQLYESFVFQGEHSFESGEYTEAIYYFELIETYGSRRPLPLMEHLALSYKKTNQPGKSIQKFKELLVTGYKSMEVYISLAEIYRDMVGDKEQAKRYFEVANELAIDRYETIYGNGYPLLLNGKFLPPEHYQLYTGLAAIYLETGDPEKAVKATNWNIHIWPDSASNYLIAARSHELLKNHPKACENFRIARSLGYREPLPSYCR